MRSMKLFYIYMIFIFPIIMICVIAINVGNVSIMYSGFAVDSSDILYIGKDGVIEKYSNGKKIGTISSKTSRGYAFTIQEDTIILSDASTVYKLDLSGDVLEKWEDRNTSVFNKLQFIRRFMANDGREYKMKSYFGRIIIQCENNVVYQMPLTEYIVKILWYTVFVSVFIFVPIIFIKCIKEKTTQGKTGDGSLCC